METNKQIVYIVTYGEAHEGAHIKGVYDDKNLAIENALKTSTHFYGDWVEQSDCFWVNGCDFVSVESWEINGQNIK